MLASKREELHKLYPTYISETKPEVPNTPIPYELLRDSNLPLYEVYAQLELILWSDSIPQNAKDEYAKHFLRESKCDTWVIRKYKEYFRAHLDHIVENDLCSVEHICNVLYGAYGAYSVKMFSKHSANSDLSDEELDGFEAFLEVIKVFNLDLSDGIPNALKGYSISESC